jgi:hypothetical protein
MARRDLVQLLAVRAAHRDARMRFTSLAALTALTLFAGAAASSAPAAKPPALQLTTEHAWQAAIKVYASQDACSDTIGMPAAKAIIRYCLYMSGATHPPCESENACSVITDHVAAQVPAAPGEIIPGESTLKASDWKEIAKQPAE